MSLSLLLLCLLWSLVEVHSQTPPAPYLTFNDSVIPNNSYVDLSLMMYPGNDDTTADISSTVICHTDLTTCCRGEDGGDQGDWYFPGGRVLPGAGINQYYSIAQRKLNQLVRLQREPPGSTGYTPDGIYHCAIETVAVNSADNTVYSTDRETVYVGVYGYGGDITIRYRMTMTVDSDLNGASPQFTLTCISTGGPATTVTWTRGSGTVVGDEVTVFNTSSPAYNAQYTHTLTVTGRLTGLYQCNVSNDKPSQASRELYVRVAGTPTNVSAEMISTSTIRVSWSPPTDGDTVTGYRLRYTDRDGEKIDTRLSRNKHSYIIDHCGENVNTSIIALSAHFASIPEEIELLLPQPESVTIHPVSATAVRISWRGNQYLSTTVRYLSYFNATGAEMSRCDTVLPPDVASTEVSLDDSVPGYQHTFTIQHIIACGDRTAPVTTATFDFDKEYFQIQFGPIDYCLNWGLEKTGRIEDHLQSHLTRIIRERCTDCSEFSEAYLRRGVFLCHGNPTTVTYRSTLVNPSPTAHPNSTHMVDIIQTWVSTSPSLTVDRLLVRVNANCPTSTVSLDDDECVSGEPDSAVTESVSTVLSVCANTLRTVLM